MAARPDKLGRDNSALWANPIAYADRFATLGDIDRSREKQARKRLTKCALMLMCEAMHGSDQHAALWAADRWLNLEKVGQPKKQESHMAKFRPAVSQEPDDEAFQGYKAKHLAAPRSQ